MEMKWRTCEHYKERSKDIGVIKNELSENLAKRNVDKAGREFIDVPAIILGEQVLYGAGGYEFGAELVTEKALSNSVIQWNNIPVVIYHTGESARTIENLENERVGFIYNAEIIGYDEKPTNVRLKCMLRLDVELLMLHEEGEDIINTFDAGDIMEMSTGYYVKDWQMQEGSFRGQEYVALQNEIIPDHLALLPNAVGAYSIEDGGGANRENEGESMKDSDEKRVAELIDERLEKVNELIDERLKEVPTKDNISDLVGKVSDKMDEVLNKLESKEAEEQEKQEEEDVAKNEEREALVEKVMENTGFASEELDGVPEAMLEKLAQNEFGKFSIPHPDIENEQEEDMNDPDLRNHKTKETE